MNPFARTQNPSHWELVKMFIGLFTLVPLRLFLFLLTTFIGGITVVIFHKLRCKAISLYLLQISCRLMLFHLGYLYIDVQGKIPPNCPPIIISNHISLIETLHLVTLMSERNKVVSFITKNSVFSIPIIGRIAKDVLQCIGVSRSIKENIRTTTTTTSSVTSRILNRVNTNSNSNSINSRKNCRIILFPEGTTTNGKHILSFKTGAFVPMKSILPIIYSFPNSGSFVPTYESIWTPVYVWRTLCQPWNNLKCTILNTIQPPTTLISKSSMSPPTPKEYSEYAQNIMAKALGVTVAKKDYHDKLQYHDTLRKEYLSHPNGSIYAMIFQPMINKESVK